MSATSAVVRWFAPVLPEARVAILRTVLYLFVILDIHLFVADPIPLRRNVELYRPLLVERLLHLPPPSVPLTITLYLVIVAGALIAAANRLPRLAGWVVAAAFTWWTAIGMSYGKETYTALQYSRTANPLFLHTFRKIQRHYPAIAGPAGILLPIPSRGRASGARAIACGGCDRCGTPRFAFGRLAAEPDHAGGRVAPSFGVRRDCPPV